MALQEAGIAGGAGRWKLRRVGARCRRALSLVLREPIFHFVLVGFALFLAGHLYQRHASIYRIVVTKRHVEQLANDYALQFGVQPDPQTLTALVRRDLQDEMLYRQGLALDLEQDDQIVRRRVVQKMQFLMQDLHAPPEPGTAALQAYYDAHAQSYRRPPQATFSHIFFSADRGGDVAARARAEAVLRTLSDATVRAPDRGDPFPDLFDFSAYEPEQVYRLFGHTPFAAAVYSAPVGHWVGPVRSGYGWHLIYVDTRRAAAQPPLSAVRDQVRTDYFQAEQDKANREAFRKLAKRFTVVDQTGKPLP
jgi:hypothetical protein